MENLDKLFQSTNIEDVILAIHIAYAKLNKEEFLKYFSGRKILLFYNTYDYWVEVYGVIIRIYGGGIWISSCDRRIMVNTASETEIKL